MLLHGGALARTEIPALEHLDIRTEVERRLHQIGLTLSTSAYSEHVGLHLSSEVTSDPAFDAASNLGLRADACALLVILWARLVLQKRTAADTRVVPGETSLFPEQRAIAARAFSPRLQFQTLLREFGPVLGGKTRLLGLVSQLRRLGFVAGRGETLEPGPLLELGIDGEKMIAFIRRSVLRESLERKNAESKGEQERDPLQARVLDSLNRRGGAAGIRELEADTSLSRPAIHRALKALIGQESVRREGERALTRYRLAQ